MNQLYDLSHAVSARLLWVMPTKLPKTSRVVKTLITEMKERLWALARTGPTKLNIFSDMEGREEQDYYYEVNFATPYLLDHKNAVIQLPILLANDAAEQRLRDIKNLCRKHHHYFELERLNKETKAFSFMCDHFFGLTLGTRTDCIDKEVILTGVRESLKQFCFPLADLPINWLPRIFADEIYDDIIAQTVAGG